ncbi:MAG: ABC-type multidrug transport system, ATPase component [Candidatus Saccharibacteria bacterium]|nr:ABC-type multidrug transport system, ATPase component [Candidatus Saccharibacteria bacterium]
MRSPQTVIQLKHVTKKFGSLAALDDVSLKIQQGEIVGFVGANGAGKTTTISTIMGFIGTTAGTVELQGQKVEPQTAHRLHTSLGYAAGDMELPARLTARQYFSFLLHQSQGDHTKQYEALSRRFKPQLDKKIGTLSRGNKQKIALIAAFVTDPDIIILDEPTSGLDPMMQEAFLDLVRESKASGKTIFMSSHYLTEVADVCSRVILMRDGAIIEDVKAHQLLEKSGKSVTIITGYRATRPPKDAIDVTTDAHKNGVSLTFVFKGSAAELQRWVASVKQLQDIEISEYNLEGAFKSLYESEEKTV